MILAGGLAKLLFLMVPEAGLEPAQGCPYRILSPARLPFHHSGTQVLIDNEAASTIQDLQVFGSIIVSSSKDQLPALAKRCHPKEVGVFDMFQLSGVTAG